MGLAGLRSEGWLTGHITFGSRLSLWHFFEAALKHEGHFLKGPPPHSSLQGFPPPRQKQGGNGRCDAWLRADVVATFVVEMTMTIMVTPWELVHLDHKGLLCAGHSATSLSVRRVPLWSPSVRCRQGIPWNHLEWLYWRLWSQDQQEELQLRGPLVILRQVRAKAKARPSLWACTWGKTPRYPPFS